MKAALYHVVQAVGLAAASPVLLARLAKGRYRSIAAARLGLGQSWLPPTGQPGAIWLHALSVGEVRSAIPLVRALAKRFPQRQLYLSVATAQGLATARELKPTGLRVFVRPLDVAWALPKVLARVRPALSILVEGDVWPGWQWALGRRGVPRMLVNGRISPRTQRGYSRLGPLSRELFRGFERVLVQTPIDLERLLDIGVEPWRVTVGGNLKFDSAPRPLEPAERAALAGELGLSGRTVLAAGSTHPGEEIACLDAFAGLRAAQPGLALLLAPREVSRGEEAARLAAERGLAAARISRGAPPAGADVVILDVLGRLASAYALAAAAFVGGSLAAIGGHNLLEPAAHGTPVLTGPHTHNFQAMAEDLIAAGGARRVADARELAAAWAELLDHPETAAAMGGAARDFCQAHRGALARVVEEAAALLGDDGLA